MTASILSDEFYGSTKILIPNVFITNDYENVKTFFLNSMTIGSLQDLSNANGSLLISGKNNKYLQHFELSYNFDSSDIQKLILELVDTDGYLEQTLSIFPLDNLKSLLNPVFEEGQYINPKGSNIESKLLDISDYASQVHRIFVSFGVGNNLRDWSDPMSFLLRTMKLDISKNGLRKYTLNFFPTNSPLFRPKLMFNFNKPNYDREFFVLNESRPAYIASIPADGKDSIESCLYKLLKNYLSVLTQTNQKNIICILPKLLPVNNSIINGQTVPSAGDVPFNDYPDPEILCKVMSPYGIELRNSVDAAKAYADAMKLNPGRTANIDIIRSQIEAISNLKNSFIFQMTATRSNSSVNPAFPDFFDPLNKINSAIKTNLNTTDDFVVIKENNLRILKFFKEYGLIEDADSQCLIVGLEGMINEWLYRNYIPNELGIESIEQFASKFKPTLDMSKCREREILSDVNYGLDYLMWTSRKKISSNFSESIIIDELSYDNNSNKFVDLFRNSKNIIKLLEIPIFTNNLKNSNILDINLQNSELYYNSFRKSIDSNFTKFFLSTIQKNIEKLNIKGLQITSIFDQYKKILDEIYRSNVKGVGSPLGSKKYRDRLKDALIQSFYFAEKSGNIYYPFSLRNNFDINYIDRGIYEPGAFGSRGKSIYESVDTDEKQKGITKEEGQQQVREENLAKLRAQILRDTGTQYTDPEQIRKILKQNHSFFERIQNLFVKNGGNIDIDSKLFLTMAIANEASTEQIVNKEDIEIYYQLASLLTTLYDVELTNERTYLDTIEDVVEKTGSISNAVSSGLFDSVYRPVSSKPNSVIFKPKNLGLGQDNIAAELWKNTTNQAYKLSIKTLPFFHLSSFRTMVMKPCFVFSKKVKVIKSKTENNELDFFSGAYNITAFRHVINTKECYSQFLLVKSVGSNFLT